MFPDISIGYRTFELISQSVESGCMHTIRSVPNENQPRHATLMMCRSRRRARLLPHNDVDDDDVGDGQTPTTTRAPAARLCQHHVVFPIQSFTLVRAVWVVIVLCVFFKTQKNLSFARSLTHIHTDKKTHSLCHSRHTINSIYSPNMHGTQ